MRNIIIAPGEHYHIYNRGVNKQNIFSDHRDWSRFLFLILYFQSIETLGHIQRLFEEFLKSNGQYSVLTKIAQDINKKRNVELVAFCLMPNHFHLILKEVEDGGIAKYMQRVLNAYTKYYNTKHKKSGHLFQGPYQAVYVEDNRQLLHLSAYIHKNPENWRSYIWSSYSDMTIKNRWGKLLREEIILGQFKNSKQYKKFVETSSAKELEEENKLGQHSVLTKPD